LTAILAILLWDTSSSNAQGSFLTPTDTFESKRYYPALGASIATYSVFAIGLNQLWYADYPRSSFHLFNDWGEWENMDKWGHAYNGYFQSHLIYQGSKWTGVGESSAILHGIVGSMLFQSTIEVLDGFSEEWGFSLPDMGFNILGVGLFVTQQKIWNEQRIKLKLSGFPVSYSDDKVIGSLGTVTTIKQRAEDLFTSAPASRILKDYNAQIQWASFNPFAFSNRDTKWPQWLNLAVGYGANHMYGGFKNEWEVDGETFVYDVQRERQFYLSFDIDLEKIPVQNRFIKTLFSVLNIIKIPLPAIEYNTQSGWHAHGFR